MIDYIRLSLSGVGRGDLSRGLRANSCEGVSSIYKLCDSCSCLSLAISLVLLSKIHARRTSTSAPIRKVRSTSSRSCYLLHAPLRAGRSICMQSVIPRGGGKPWADRSLLVPGSCLTLVLSLILKEGLVHQRIVLLNHLEHLLLAWLHDVPAYDQFLKDKVGLVEVEDEI